jgi:hypothetical protein
MAIKYAPRTGLLQTGRHNVTRPRQVSSIGEQPFLLRVDTIVPPPLKDRLIPRITSLFPSPLVLFGKTETNLPCSDDIGSLSNGLSDNRLGILSQEFIAVQYEPPVVLRKLGTYFIVNNRPQGLSEWLSRPREGDNPRIYLGERPDKIPGAIGTAVVEDKDLLTVRGCVVERLGDDVVLILDQADRVNFVGNLIMGHGLLLQQRIR